MPCLLLRRAVLLAGVCVAAAAGWAGARIDLTRVPAWQPSPTSAAPAVRPWATRQPPPIPGAGPRVRWQPSPVPETPSWPAEADAVAAPTAPADPAPADPAPAAPAPATARRPLPPLPLPATNAFGYVPRHRPLHHDQIAAAFDGSLPEQRGRWREVRFFSRSLGREAGYLAWLPPGDAAGGPYPTLYLLHGAGGPAGHGKEEWLAYSLAEDLDRLLALGLIQPMLVILPDGEQGYWINHAGGGPRWADFVASDLVKHVDATFPTEPSRLRRAIGGHSMGGHGALQLALNHPDVFGIAGAHSPSLRPYQTSPAFFGDLTWFSRHDPLSLARSSPAARSILTWLDVGHDDRWRPAVESLRRALDAQGAPLEFRLLEGDHQSWYWKHYLPEYLRFYATALYAEAQTPDGAPVVPTEPQNS